MKDHGTFQKLNAITKQIFLVSHHTKSHVSVPTKVTRNKIEADLPRNDQQEIPQP